MQFKMSVVKYSKRDYIFKPFWAPFGPLAGPCRPTGSGSRGSCALQLLSFQRVPVPSPELSPTADTRGFSALFLLSHVLIVPLDVHMQGVVCKVSTGLSRELWGESSKWRSELNEGLSFVPPGCRGVSALAPGAAPPLLLLCLRCLWGCL